MAGDVDIARAGNFLNFGPNRQHALQITSKCVSLRLPGPLNALAVNVHSCAKKPWVLRYVQLAHRIRKRQYSLPMVSRGRALSLKEQWDRALGWPSEPTAQDDDCSPSMHQISMSGVLAANARTLRLGGRRSPRKIAFGRSLYLLVMPKGGRYWRYFYRYGKKQKTLALDTYPDVPVDRAPSRHQAARELLANGVDPAIRRKELRRAAHLP